MQYNTFKDFLFSCTAEAKYEYVVSANTAVGLGGRAWSQTVFGFSSSDDRQSSCQEAVVCSFCFTADTTTFLQLTEEMACQVVFFFKEGMEMGKEEEEVPEICNAWFACCWLVPGAGIHGCLRTCCSIYLLGLERKRCLKSYFACKNKKNKVFTSFFTLFLCFSVSRLRIHPVSCLMFFVLLCLRFRPCSTFPDSAIITLCPSVSAAKQEKRLMLLTEAEATMIIWHPGL